MSTSRRTFLKLSAVAGGSVGLGLIPGVSGFSEALDGISGSTGKAPKSLRILVLGGTGFTGPHQVRYALSRGHDVTLFNRGRRPQPWPGNVVELVGDRNTGD